MKQKGWHHYFAEVLYVDEHVSIHTYYPNLSYIDGQSFELDSDSHAALLPDHYQAVVALLDETFDIFDIKDSDNFGMNEAGTFIFIDYGMTKALYNSEWVPRAKAGGILQDAACAVREKKSECTAHRKYEYVMHAGRRSNDRA